ncbi:MAG: mevalonate kinase family protein [Acidimicrobiales bacterium]
MIVNTAPARVGILGNPSDGYGGRTLSLALPQFEATVELETADELEIVANEADRPRWASVGDLVDRIDRHGYGTGPQLLAATVRTFADVAASVEYRGFDRHRFRLSYSTTIPRQVGLGGSSALVVATLKSLSELTGIEIPLHILPSIALRVETEQLGINAGLQDRVIQSYGGLVAMNFGEMTTDARFGVSHGDYRSLDPAGVPNLFLAYREQAAEPSDGYHRALRQRFEGGDGAVRETLRALAALVVEGEAALRWNNADRLAELIAKNMSLRKLLGPIPEAQLELVEAADECEAPATFGGSGGAIVGAYVDDEHLERVAARLSSLDAVTVRIEAEH